MTHLASCLTLTGRPGGGLGLDAWVSRRHVLVSGRKRLGLVKAIEALTDVMPLTRIKSNQIKSNVRLLIGMANNSGRTCVKQELVSVFVLQAYQEITIRQLSLMLRQLQ